jgi:long-subunit fatty acid transport protein
MLKGFFTVTVISFFMLQMGVANAQVNFTQNGNGARAAGMGYAFTGIADDASAISWNSAGLTQLYSMEATIVGRLSAGNVDYDFGEDYGWDITTAANFQINFASFVIPFSVGKFNVVGGIAYRTIYDFNKTINFDFGDGNSTENKHVGSIRAITPALAIQLAKSLSLGVAYNFYGGKYQHSNDGTLDDYTDSKFSGSSLDLGILFKPSDKFSVGANMNFPYTSTRSYEMEGHELETKVPFFWNIGAAYKVSDQFTLSFDYQARDWRNSEDFEEEDYNNLSSFHVGMEYLIVTESIVIPLRGGYYTRPLGFKDYQDELVQDNVFTLGAGLMIGSVVFDASFEFEPMAYDLSSTVAISKNTLRTTLGASIHFGD